MNIRAKKYKAKIDGDVCKALYDAQKPFMVAQEAAATKDLVRIETQVKRLVQGAPIIHLPYYIIFGKEIYKKRNKFKAQTLHSELRIIEEKWWRRGLDMNLLENIKHFFVESYPWGITFRLDISDLDGPHVLG